MSRYINADELRAKMYHEAFETDTDEQKWDGGCWIRYKMFERNLEAMPAADVAEVVRCKDCKNNPMRSLVGCPMAGLGERPPTDYCSYGERKDG